MFYILNKENILNVIKNYEPKHTSSNIVEYELVDNNSNKINIFFQKDLLELLPISSYSIIFDLILAGLLFTIKFKIFSFFNI